MGIHLRSEHAAMSEINVTPLVDVMLVLLVIFIVTAPLLIQAVPVELPKTAAPPPVGAPDSRGVTATSCCASPGVPGVSLCELNDPGRGLIRWAPRQLLPALLYLL